MANMTLAGLREVSPSLPALSDDALILLSQGGNSYAVSLQELKNYILSSASPTAVVGIASSIEDDFEDPKNFFYKFARFPYIFENTASVVNPALPDAFVIPAGVSVVEIILDIYLPASFTGVVSLCKGYDLESPLEVLELSEVTRITHSFQQISVAEGDKLSLYFESADPNTYAKHDVTSADPSTITLNVIG